MGVSTDALSKDARVGHEWANGHFEVKGHVTGDLTVRGRKFKVNCYEGMDHRRGSRKDLGTRAVSWISTRADAKREVEYAVPRRHGRAHRLRAVVYLPLGFDPSPKDVRNLSELLANEIWSGTSVRSER